MDSDLEWYSRSLEVLQPLRYHLNEVIGLVDSYNSFCNHAGQTPVPMARVEAARVALERAEVFFTGNNL